MGQNGITAILGRTVSWLQPFRDPLITHLSEFALLHHLFITCTAAFNLFYKYISNWN